MPDIMHGGAIMSFADNIGAVATVANLPPGATTTTLESKTNFFAAIPVGDTARAECTPLHRGRTTMVWQTRITRNDGRLCAHGHADATRAAAEEGLAHFPFEKFFRRDAELQRQPRIEPLGQRGMRFLPNRNGCLQAAGALLREPNCAAALILFGDGDLDKPGCLQAAQIARQRRLVEPGSLGESAKCVVGCGCDLPHQPKLGEAQSTSRPYALRGNW